MITIPSAAGKAFRPIEVQDWPADALSEKGCSHPVGWQKIPPPATGTKLTCQVCGEQTVDLQKVQDHYKASTWKVLARLGAGIAERSKAPVFDFLGITERSEKEQASAGSQTGSWSGGSAHRPKA